VFFEAEQLFEGYEDTLALLACGAELTRSDQAFDLAFAAPKTIGSFLLGLEWRIEIRHG
jgi:hypothetical protein